MSEHGVTRHRCKGKHADMCRRLAEELRQRPPSEELARAVAELNARRPDIDSIAYRAVAEALRVE